MRTIVYRILVDPSTVKLIGEREKGKLFARIGFLRPKPEDIQFESLEKFYDSFLTRLDVFVGGLIVRSLKVWFSLNVH